MPNKKILWVCLVVALVTMVMLWVVLIAEFLYIRHQDYQLQHPAPVTVPIRNEDRYEQG